MEIFGALRRIVTPERSAFVVSVLSLGISFATAWQTLRIDHQLTGMILRVSRTTQDVTASVLIENPGNQIETLQSVSLRDQPGRALAQSGPKLFKPGDAAIVVLKYAIPKTGVPQSSVQPLSASDNAMGQYDTSNPSKWILPLTFQFIIIDGRKTKAANARIEALPEVLSQTSGMRVALDGDRRPIPGDDELMVAPFKSVLDLYVDSAVTRSF